jgi:hypothetical protein
MIAQLLIGEYRRQLVPAYGLTLLVFGLALIGRARSGHTMRRRAISIVLGLLGCLSTVLVALPPLLLPIPHD